MSLYWTYKTLALTEGKPEWLNAAFKFPTIDDAALAATAYMVAHAEKGEMVVVSLEPSPGLAPVSRRLQEHARMLAMLKNLYAVEPTTRLSELIRQIDPTWDET